MDPVLKRFINTLKCPVCNAQIEGTEYRFYCVSNRNHYLAYIVDDTVSFTIIKEELTINDGSRQYNIVQDKNNTAIWVCKIDADGGRISDKNPPAPFFYNKKLFDFLNTNREKIVNRVRTILVFQ